MAAPADIWVRMTGLTLLRVGFRRQTMAVTNPGKGMVFWFARMTLDTRRIFVAHATALRVRPISKPMLFFIISSVIGGVRCLIMAHDAVFRGIFAVVTNQAIFHLRVDHVPIEVFPFGDTGVATAAFEFLMLFMGKNEIFPETFAGAHCLAGFLEMTKTTVAFFASLEVTLKTTLFTGSAESIVNFNLLRENTADARSNNVGRSQWLPARWHCRHRCFAAFAVDMTDSAVNRILFVSFM